MASTENMSVVKQETPKHSKLDSTFPVYLPYDPALFLSQPDFQLHVESLLAKKQSGNSPDVKQEGRPITPTRDLELRVKTPKRPANGEPEDAPRRQKSPFKESPARQDPAKESPFMEAMMQNATRFVTQTEMEAENKMLTENSDLAYASTKSPLVDLFYELEETLSAGRLKELLTKAWEEDPSATLKIIFNARSIHLGKSSRIVSYRAFGWLAETHPLTLLVNLPWLTRPIIEKKVKKNDLKSGLCEKDGKFKEEDDKDMVLIDFDGTKENPESTAGSLDKMHDLRFGVSHGYWKDLLNLLAVAANGQLTADGKPNSVLNNHPDGSSEGKRMREWDAAKAKKARKTQEKTRHDQVLGLLEKDEFYRALHLTVSRLFATQLREDAKLLKSEKKSDLKKLSLAAKWAPSFSEFHDKHTFIVSSIAEILYPKPSDIGPQVPSDNRDTYLRHAREAYRRLVVSPLRKALAVVERDIAAETFENIKYDRVPSLAMERYTPLFIKKDYDHFYGYVEKVASGKNRISGATLLPSTLVNKARSLSHGRGMPVTRGRGRRKAGASQRVNLEAQAVSMVEEKVSDGQWKTLVQRIRDSGALESSIAICDVSGSMSYPVFKDGTCPMDSSIGLSLLLAEIVEPPFGGAFITFSSEPAIVNVGGPDDKRTLKEKVQYMGGSNWAMNTNFVAVFEKLILPMAIEHKLKPEDMVKKVFVFSDMQFDVADSSSERWTTSFERIQQKYKEAGYEMPKLIFWNLAGGRAGYDDGNSGMIGQNYYSESTEIAPKPVTADEVNTALVSGYSQGQLKMFLENSSFEDPEIEEEVVDVMEDGTGEEIVNVEVQKREKMDPLTMVRKAISHKAYSMLEVVD